MSVDKAPFDGKDTFLFAEGAPRSIGGREPFLQRGSLAFRSIRRKGLSHVRRCLLPPTHNYSQGLLVQLMKRRKH